MNERKRTPQHDSLAESPIDWVDVPLGPGQEDRPVGHVQFTFEGDALRGTDIRRAPGYESLGVVSRWPWAPA